jgi:hypothetical protein
MSLKLKEATDFILNERKAARRRAADTPHVEIEEKRLDSLEQRTIELKSLLEAQRSIRGGGLMTSASEVNFIKNAKYQAALMADKTNTLGERIQHNVHEGFSIIEGIERSLASLESDIKESELEFKNGYTKVHFNSFVRHIDMDEDFETTPVRRDPKTDIPYISSSICEIVPGVGVTLPLLHEESIAFIDASLVSEGTDRGDTENPLIQTSPRNVLLPNGLFRYYIVKREFDETSRLYKAGDVTCTLQLELSGLQLINTLVIEPVSSSSIFLTNLKCVSDNGTEITIEIEPQELIKKTTLLFGAIRARYIIFTFKQYAPVERTQISMGNSYAEKFNELLESSGLTPTLSESKELVYGAAYDFSLKSIKGFFREYNSTGVFTSGPIRAKNLISLSLNENTETPSYVEDQYLYGNTIETPSIERYVHADVKTPTGQLCVTGLIPLRDSSNLQNESLPLFGKISRLKFFPDIYKDLSKGRCTATYNGSLNLWVVTCADGIPGLSSKTTGVLYTDSDLRFIGADGSELVAGPANYVKLTATSLWVAPFGTGNRDRITSVSLPYLYGFFVSEQTNSIVVSDSGAELVLGTDYQLSFDRGSTWVSVLPWGVATLGQEMAGDVWVKFLSPDYTERYSVEYPVLKNQWLEQTKTFRMKNYRITVAPEKKHNICSLRSVYVIRASSESTYYTPVIQNYSLNLRELNVNK